MFKYSIYRSLITRKKAMFTASKGKCGHAGYRELQAMFHQGQWVIEIVDGYKSLFYKTYPASHSLKQVINLAWGQSN